MVRGHPYEVIGFQKRAIRVEGVRYEWSEYLLFNPYRGFRYLTEYEGHWNLVTPLRTLPVEGPDPGYRDIVTVLGEHFKHFQSAEATTEYVLGEFPWRVQVGERVKVDDYVHPPRLVSAERAEGEVTWSMGEYTLGAHVWSWFKLPGAPPSPTGVYANQPSPAPPVTGAWWKAWAALAALVLVGMVFRFGTHEPAEVFRYQRVMWPPHAPLIRGADTMRSAVTAPFTIGGRTSNVELSIATDLRNSWAFFSFALINDSTGTAYDFGREVSYYAGRDADGSWFEGSPRARAVAGGVPAGRYYLRVEVATPAEAGPLVPLSYTIRVRRDVPLASLYTVALLLLTLPPVISLLWMYSFEYRRWQESDYPWRVEE